MRRKNAKKKKNNDVKLENNQTNNSNALSLKAKILIGIGTSILIIAIIVLIVIFAIKDVGAVVVPSEVPRNHTTPPPEYERKVWIYNPGGSQPSGNFGGYTGAQSVCNSNPPIDTTGFEIETLAPYLVTSEPPGPQNAEGLIPESYWDAPVYAHIFNDTQISATWRDMLEYKTNKIPQPSGTGNSLPVLFNVNTAGLATGMNHDGTGSGHNCNNWTSGLSNVLFTTIVRNLDNPNDISSFGSLPETGGWNPIGCAATFLNFACIATLKKRIV